MPSPTDRRVEAERLVGRPAPVCEQACEIVDLVALVGVGLVPRAGEYHLRVGVAYGEQRRVLAPEGLGRADVVAHLYVELLASPHRHEVDLPLVEDPRVGLVATAQELDGHHILQHAAEVHVARPELGVAEGVVDQVVLVAGREVALPPDVVAPDAVEGERLLEK